MCLQSYAPHSKAPVSFPDLYYSPACQPVEELYVQLELLAATTDPEQTLVGTQATFSDVYVRPDCMPTEALYEVLDTHCLPLSTSLFSRPATVGFADIYTEPACVAIETLYSIALLDHAASTRHAGACSASVHDVDVPSSVPTRPASLVFEKSNVQVIAMRTDWQDALLVERRIQHVLTRRPSGGSKPESQKKLESDIDSLEISECVNQGTQRHGGYGFADIYTSAACICVETMYAPLDRTVQSDPETQRQSRYGFADIYTSAGCIGVETLYASLDNTVQSDLPCPRAQASSVGVRTPSKFIIKSKIQASLDNVAEALQYFAVST